MTATTEPETRSASRRTLLAGALGGIGAWAATTIGRTTPVRGADGQAVLVGGEYTATSATGFVTTTANALYGFSSSGIGVAGDSNSQIGVSGYSASDAGVFGHSTTNIGIHGRSTSSTQPAALGQTVGNSTGVQGVSGGDIAAPAAKAKTGVYGYANQDGGAKGIYGESAKGYAGYFAGKVYTSKFHEMKETSTPPAPGTNKARLFLRDNGSGKTQLCVRFNTGGVLVIKTQP